MPHSRRVPDTHVVGFITLCMQKLQHRVALQVMLAKLAMPSIASKLLMKNAGTPAETPKSSAEQNTLC